MSLPLSFLRPSALRAIEILPSKSRTAILTRRSIYTAPTRTYRSHGLAAIPIRRTAGEVIHCQRRYYADESIETPKGPTQDGLPSVTEEAEQTAEILGDEGGRVEELGTPVEEIIKRDGDTDIAPEVIKERISESESQSSETTNLTSSPLKSYFNPIPKVTIPPYLPAIPTIPIPASHSLKHRYHPLIRQLTPHFMHDGKLARAQRTMQDVLRILRTRPAPRATGRFPLVPNAPELSVLPTDPVAYLQTAIDSVAPLVKLKSSRGSGGTTVQIPSPLPVRARRRKAVEWMLEAADRKRKVKTLAERFAEEVEAVVLGTSTAWEKRIMVHRLAVTNRANITSRPTGKRR